MHNPRKEKKGMDWLILKNQLTNPKNIALATASFLASLKTSSTLSAYLKTNN